MGKLILQNEAQCHKCGDVIWSGSRHDYRSCSCRTIAVDGGQEYIRRVWHGGAHDYTERSLTVSDGQAFLRLCDMVGFMRSRKLTNRHVALLVIFCYHTDHEKFDEAEIPTLLNDCVEAIKTAAETGRNSFGIVLAVMRKLRDWKALDVSMFEERPQGVHPELFDPKNFSED